MHNHAGLFTDVDGCLSSRIIALFIIIIFDLIIILISLILQKDIPNNASNVLITITTACIPIALCSQTYQNIKEKEKIKTEIVRNFDNKRDEDKSEEELL